MPFVLFVNMRNYERDLLHSEEAINAIESVALDARWTWA